MTHVIFSEEEIISDIDCISTENVVALRSHVIDQRFLSDVIPLYRQRLKFISRYQLNTNFKM